MKAYLNSPVISH